MALAGLLLMAVLWRLDETNRQRDPTAARPRRILANYRRLLGHRRYLGYAGLVACAYGGIFAFISGSSFLFIDTLGLSPDRFGLSFGVVVVGYMLGTLLSGRLALRLGIDRLIALGAGTALAGGAPMLLLALVGPPGIVAVIGPFFVFMVGAGLILPNAMAGAVGPFPAMAGAASSLLGFCQMTAAALIGIAVGHLADGTALPIAGAVFAVAVGAAALRATVIGGAPRG